MIGVEFGGANARLNAATRTIIRRRPDIRSFKTLLLLTHSFSFSIFTKTEHLSAQFFLQYNNCCRHETDHSYWDLRNCSGLSYGCWGHDSRRRWPIPAIELQTSVGNMPYVLHIISPPDEDAKFLMCSLKMASGLS